MSETPPPPPGSYGPPGGFQPPPAGGYGAPGLGTGVGRPGELLDRFLARLIDGVVLAVVDFVIVSAIIGGIIGAGGDGGAATAAAVVLSLLTVALNLGYYAVLDSRRGQTLGKMAMKLKVVGPSGGNPTATESLKRNIWLAVGILGLLGTLGSLLSFVLGVAAIVVIVVGINQLPDRRTKFDEFAGGTQVLKVG